MSIPRRLLYFQREKVKRNLRTSYTEFAFFTQSPDPDLCGSSVLNGKAKEYPSGATSTTEAKKRKRGRKGGNAKQTEKTPIKQRTSSIVLCQHYEGHQLFTNVAVQISKANKGQAGMAIMSVSGQS